MKVRLESLLAEVVEKTTENNQHPVLTSSKSGLYLQSDYFNKQVASKDNTGYKIIRRGQFTYRAMSDTGEFYPNMLECADIGIVSPAYPVFEITDTRALVPEYLKYFFKSGAFQHAISSFAQGSTRTSVKFDKMKTVTIDLPKSEQQAQIVATLDKLLCIIAQRQQQLAKLDELVKARFVEMTQSDKSVIPTRMGDIASYINGYAFKPTDWTETGKPIIRIQNLNDLAAKFNFYSGELDEKYAVSDGDILVSWATHLEAYIWNRGDAWLNQHIFKAVFDKMTVNKIYFVYATEEALRQAFKNAHGFKPTMEHIKRIDFENAIVQLPSLETQNQFAAFVEQTDKSKFNDNDMKGKYNGNQKIHFQSAIQSATAQFQSAKLALLRKTKGAEDDSRSEKSSVCYGVVLSSFFLAIISA